MIVFHPESTAFLLGAGSALSLFIGALLGVGWKIPPKTGAVLSAFGSGALLAALAVELVGPASVSGAGTGRTTIGLLAAGSLCGGILFSVINALINKRGGYLRSVSATIAFRTRERRAHAEKLLSRLGSIEFLRSIPARGIQELVDHVESVSFPTGGRLFQAGDAGDCLYLIESGNVQLFRGRSRKALDTISSGHVLGEIALLTGAPRNATAVAADDVTAFCLSRSSFEELCRRYPELDQAARSVAGRRLEERQSRAKSSGKSEAAWLRAAAGSLKDRIEVPSESDLEKEEKGTGNPLAVWLGILIDGIPGGLVIGLHVFSVMRKTTGGVSLASVVPSALIAGLFLANFPTALSASASMRRQGWSVQRVLWMWISLILAIGGGAWLGCAVGARLDALFIAALSGLAAGAMLSVLAQAMIPEAVYLAGPGNAGISLLIGFALTLAVKAAG